MDIWLTTEHKEIWSIHLDSSFLRISGCVFRAGSWWHWMCTCEQSPGMPAKVTVFLCSNHVSIHGYKKHVNKLMDIHMIDSTVTWKSLSCVRLFVTHGLFSPWNSPGQNTGVGNHSLLQGVFSTQRLNLGLQHCRQILYCLSHQGSLHVIHNNSLFIISEFMLIRWLTVGPL